MKFTPKTDAELKQSPLLAGNADFVVNSAIEKVSQSNNPMIELELRVVDSKGNSAIIRDWLLAKNTSKLKSFLIAIGQVDLYERGDISVDAIQDAGGKLVIINRKNGEGYDIPRVKSYRNSVTKQGSHGASDDAF